MAASKRNEEREERIAMEIVVDCYNETEVWSGWFCHIESTLTFPSQAECIQARRSSPLKVGERVTVTGMLDDDEAANSLAEMQVEIDWQGRKLGVPLAQLKGVGVDEETAEVIADWHYWVSQGRQF